MKENVIINMKIALIADILTTTALKYEADVHSITPLNYKMIFKFWKPDILFVESAWQGHKNRWKYKIASYRKHQKRNNKKLAQVVHYAKKLGIPTVFWNKEDGVHYERFIQSAKLFDHIFTVDENCIEKYRKVVHSSVSVDVLMFAVGKSIHYFSGFNFKYNSANFIGSYSQHLHKRRKVWQDMIFEAACGTQFSVDIWDRNSDRKSQDYRYPDNECLYVHKAIPYEKTSEIYKKYLVSLNVNTIEDSPTMFSRRLVEILACGGIVITNNTPAVEKYFKDYCYIVSTKSEAVALFERLKDGPSQEELVRAKAGAAYIAKTHTWKHRLEEVCKVVGI